MRSTRHLTRWGSNRQSSYLTLVILILAIAVSGACRRRAATATPPPVPEPARQVAPTVSLTVEPATIQRGQSATLRWSSSGATDLDLQPAFGRVEQQGSVSVTPNDSITYTLTGRGPSGSTQATARVTVTAAPPLPPVAAPARPTETTLRERYEREIQDAFFDYDQSDLRDDGRSAMMKSAAFLRDNPTVTVQVEGHCDERGSVAYNLGLGDRRSNSTRDFLVSQGISGDRVTTISYGKEKPFCTEQSESCFQENRRAHLICTNCGM
ncbi:MAG: OmpA family protein [Acidobacteria bacterium]|nr:OmpA family protein [Acidobacteriota bacterium]